MAVIQCEECGGAVSTRAAACPHCGAPMVQAVSHPAESSTNEPAAYEPTRKRFADWPWWQRALTSFVLLFILLGSFRAFQEYEKAENTKEVMRIALGTAKKVDKSLEDLKRASDQRYNSALTADKLVGNWSGSQTTMKVQGGTIRVVSDTYTFERGGTYSGTGVLDLTLDESRLFSGRYRISEKGKFGLRGDRIYWTTLELQAEPILTARDSIDKRQAMALIAQNMTEDSDRESDDQIVSFSNDRFVMRTELDNGQIIDTIYRRR